LSRQNIMLVQEYVRLANVLNDHLDACSYICRGISPQDGTAIQIRDTLGGPLRVPTVDDLINLAQREVGTFKVSSDALDLFNSKAAPQGFNSDVQGYCGDPKSVVDGDITMMRTVREQVATMLTTATTMADLQDIAAYIDLNVPKLVMLRRAWAM
jgi:hypothetical protein